MRSALPPGPRSPSLIQAIGVWTRPLAYPERLRARYGKRFTTRFPLSPPFVVLSDPDEIKQVFMAPPDVLHPGEGARVLEPLVGKNSVILLDEARHFLSRRAHSDTSRQIGDRGAEARGSVFDDDGVFHRSLRSQSSPACR